jgi:hypothetical protein
MANSSTINSYHPRLKASQTQQDTPAYANITLRNFARLCIVHNQQLAARSYILQSLIF